MQTLRSFGHWGRKYGVENWGSCLDSLWNLVKGGKAWPVISYLESKEHSRTPSQMLSNNRRVKTLVGVSWKCSGRVAQHLFVLIHFSESTNMLRLLARTTRGSLQVQPASEWWFHGEENACTCWSGEEFEKSHYSLEGTRCINQFLLQRPLS